jgi:hypothetical protein
MFQTFAHAFGIPMTPKGWQTDFRKHEHYILGQWRKKADAIKAAEECEVHAVVVRAHMSAPLFDNGKEPHPNPFEARRLWQKAI